MTDLRDLLGDAAEPPRRAIDVQATAAMADARRDRQRVRSRVGTGSAAVAIGVAVALVFGGGSGGGRVEIATGADASNADAGVHVVLPEGWQQLPLVERATSPQEVLVVGTADRPVGEPIQACTFNEGMPTTRSAFVTIYEYGGGDTPNLGGGIYSPEAFQPRPLDFTTGAGRGYGGDCPNVPLQQIYDEFAATTSTAPLPAPDDTAPTTSTSIVLPEIPAESIVNHFREIPFTEQDRRFLARVVTVEDPDGALLEAGLGILNSLAVSAPAAPATTTTVAPGFDEEAATQQIVDAINASMGTPSPTPSELSIEGGHPFADPAAAEAAAEKAKNSDPLTRDSYEGSLEGKLVATINWIEFDSPTYARLNFDVFNDGQLATATTTGYAVFEDGFWRLGRGTFCEIAMRGGVNCQ